VGGDLRSRVYIPLDPPFLRGTLKQNPEYADVMRMGGDSREPRRGTWPLEKRDDYFVDALRQLIGYGINTQYCFSLLK
jgi:hypothetical protein